MLTNPDAAALVEEFASQASQLYPDDLKDLTAGVKFQNAAPRMQCDVVMAMLAWLENRLSHDDKNDIKARTLRWRMQNVFSLMLKRKLLFTDEEVVTLLNWPVDHPYSVDQPPIARAASNYLKDHSISDALYKAAERFIRFIESNESSYEKAEKLRSILHLKELIGYTTIRLPLVAGDVWAEAALSELGSLDTKLQTAWAELLLHCLRATGAMPSSKWPKEADKYLDAIGKQDFFNKLLHWFPLVDNPPTFDWYTSYDIQNRLSVNVDTLKGLVWLSSKSDDPQIARALTALAISTYKKIPGSRPRATKVGNACFWALGNMPGSEGVAQLSFLKTRIKTNTAQKAIINALEIAAKRIGISAEDIEELSMPTYGLEDVGLRRDDFGEAVSELRIDGSEVEQTWTRSDGTRLASAPKAVKEKHSEEVKEIAQAIKGIRKMLPAQRERIDNLYLLQKKWTFGSWQARYINHPLIGTIARRLIWKFTKRDKATSAIWFDGRIIGRDNQPVDWLDDSTTVELWHPINEGAGVVLEWRQWLLDHEIRQPFKQAHREIYLLTDAERNTHAYSNRYAAHILRQHQFNSLCAVRGWRNSLRLLVDATFPPAAKVLPHWGLRAEYWIEGVGDEYGTDTNDTGTYLYVTTDQVRFFRTDNDEPLPLEEIPRLVFSEVMRDVDMFVGVASVGNDPTWLDGGDVRHQHYWHSYSFGDLTESSKTRKQVFETLVPRLKIAERCKLIDKFLVVRGDIRTYKIHLGSGNILMEPNDQYLCIVPSQRSGAARADNLFVPFEGDQTLAIILSKAFLLAEDKKIADPTITRQLRL